MKMYFAGAENGQFYPLLLKNGVKSLLASAYYLDYDVIPEPLQHCDLLMDSGGFTARMHGKTIDVAKYADFLNRNKIKLAFNLDTNDVDETLKNQDYLEQNTQTKILPVYHFSDYQDPNHRDLIYEYIKKHDFIALGGVAGLRLPPEKQFVFLDFVFALTKDKIKIHGLGQAAMKLHRRYPYYSADSTSWLAGGKFRSLTKLEGFGTKVMNKSILKGDKRSEIGYNLIHQRYEDLNIYNIKEMLKIEDFVTRLWASRGVKWEN